MKKKLSVLFVLMFLMTDCTVCAEELPREEYYPLGSTGLEMWIAPGLNALELTQENLEDDYIAYFNDEMDTRSVEVMCIPDYPVPLEEYAETLYYFDEVSDISLTVINGLRCLTYIEAVPNLTLFRVTTLLDSGDFVEISFSPYDDPDYSAVVDSMARSVRPAE